MLPATTRPEGNINQERRKMNVHFSPMLPQHSQSVIDIFNYYVENGFSAYSEKKVSHEFFDMLMDVSHGYPAIVAEDNHDQVIGFALLRAHHPMSTFS